MLETLARGFLGDVEDLGTACQAAGISALLSLHGATLASKCPIGSLVVPTSATTLVHVGAISVVRAMASLSADR